MKPRIEFDPSEGGGMLVPSQGTEWKLAEDQEGGGRLFLYIDDHRFIVIGLHDNGFPEDKERVKIFKHIKDSYNFLKGVKRGFTRQNNETRE